MRDQVHRERSLVANGKRKKSQELKVLKEIFDTYSARIDNDENSSCDFKDESNSDNNGILKMTEKVLERECQKFHPDHREETSAFLQSTTTSEECNNEDRETNDSDQYRDSVRTGPKSEIRA